MATVENDLSKTRHTIVLSDLHLTEAEAGSDRHPHWKAYKRAEHFVDADFAQLLERLHAELPGEAIELVLNGDVFDFDSVLARPEEGAGFSVGWVERLRGLNSEEQKSLFKLSRILHEHAVFVEALHLFVTRGHRVVFVIGNHDVELHWPSAHEALLTAVTGGDAALRERVRIADWFYLSNHDTLIEHGHQHDEYCLVLDPMNPFVDGEKTPARVRLPFGNLAERYMINGMGLFNPHVDKSFIKPNLLEYVRFFVREVIAIQPLLVWTWFWGACVTLLHATWEGALPARKIEVAALKEKAEAIAQKSNVAAAEVWAMRELRAHPAVQTPWRVAQELWLDRVLVFLFAAIFSAASFALARQVADVSLSWLGFPLLIAAPFVAAYLRQVRSQVTEAAARGRDVAASAARLLGVRRVIHGHTHDELHTWVKGVEYLNTGTWSPAFHDLACTQRYGSMCFAWVRPASGGEERIGSLFVFEHGAWSERPAPEAEAQHLARPWRQELAPAQS